jgi:hypothetical protein
MLYFILKAAISGLLVATVSEVARRSPGWGGLLASLPLTSLLALSGCGATPATSRVLPALPRVRSGS